MEEKEKARSVPGWLLIFLVIGGAALLVPLAVNQPAKPPSPSGPVGTPITPGVRALLAQDYERARAALTKARERVEPGSLEARQLPLLLRVAELWSSEPFERAAAKEALKELEAAAPLPAGLTSWIKVQRSKRGL
jgi:hypothetical protein